MPRPQTHRLALLFGLVCGCVSAHADERRPNVLLICVDDLRPELRAFGVDYIDSPNIDRLAASGRAFHRHYVQAPTCGASRYAMLTGRYGPGSNHALFQRAKKIKDESGAVPLSMPEWFRKNGYTTVSVGKVSHHPGGWGGEDWDDTTDLEMPMAWDRQRMPCGKWRHPRGAMHGLAHGETRPPRSANKKMDALQSLAGPDTIYPDGLIADEGAAQLAMLAASEQPFFLAIGLIKPHLPFGAPQQYLEPYRQSALPPIPHPLKPNRRTTWHRSAEFFSQYHHGGRDPRADAAYADRVRRHYAACVTYADKHVGDILAQLRNTGLENNTIVVLWGDHGWHLGEHAIWGKHCLFEEALRSPLIIRAPGMRAPGQKSNAVVETIDIFPSLCELTGISIPDSAHGKSLLPQLTDPDAPGGNAYSYRGSTRSLRTDSHRFTLHADGFIELYDHRTPAKETQNVADKHPDLCTQLTRWTREKNARHNSQAE